MQTFGGPGMSTYLSIALADRLTAAQGEVDRHIVTGRDGRCRSCGEIEPCLARRVAAAMLAQYGRLPHRRPGLASSRLW
jgi:hypothetical protein